MPIFGGGQCLFEVGSLAYFWEEMRINAYLVVAMPILSRVMAHCLYGTAKAPPRDRNVHLPLVVVVVDGSLRSCKEEV